MLSEGTSETQTGGTPPSGHQGKPLLRILSFMCELKGIKGYNSISTIHPSVTTLVLCSFNHTHTLFFFFHFFVTIKNKGGRVLMGQVDAVFLYLGLLWTFL